MLLKKKEDKKKKEDFANGGSDFGIEDDKI